MPQHFKQGIQNQTRRQVDLLFTNTPDFVYKGFLCDSSDSEFRTLSQAVYIKLPKCFCGAANIRNFRSFRAKDMWVVPTLPHIARAAAMILQATMETFQHDSNVTLNPVARYLQRKSELTLRFCKLDHKSPSMIVYADSSFNNNPEHTSQSGFKICLADSSEQCMFLHNSLHQSHCNVRSSMAAETLAFKGGFYNAFIIKHSLERILSREIILIGLTDSKLFF